MSNHANNKPHYLPKGCTSVQTVSFICYASIKLHHLINDNAFPRDKLSRFATPLMWKKKVFLNFNFSGKFHKKLLDTNLIQRL